MKNTEYSELNIHWNTLVSNFKLTLLCNQERFTFVYLLNCTTGQEFFTCTKISPSTDEGQHSLSLCSKLMHIEQGRIFIVPRPQRNCSSVLRLIDWLVGWFDVSRHIGSIVIMDCCSSKLTSASFDWPLASFWRSPNVYQEHALLWHPRTL